jgi:pimeloyl-ACP methyl ester carboxylesterase
MAGITATALGARLNDGLSVITVGEGPPLVSIPGLGPGADLSAAVSRSDTWSARALATATGRTVHQINRPLDMPTGTTIADVARWYATALRERFDGPVDVVGASAGGVTALQLALDHPDVVRRLVVEIAAARLGDRGRQLLLDNVRLDGRRWRAAWAGSALMARGPMRILGMLALVPTGSRPRAAGEVAMIRAGQSWDVTARLGEITAPTLVVGGTRDAVFPAELIAATARGIPGAELVLLPRRGHFTTLLDRRASAAITRFLRG